MTNNEFKAILTYFNTLIEQGTSTGDADFIIEATDNLQNLIKFHLNVLEEEDDEP